jgi:ATP-dependent Lhr-like helicase
VQSIGFRNFMELYSVFTTPPLFRVLHGRLELGEVHEASFQVPSGERPVLLLGGRSWAVTHLDWTRRIAYVEPADLKGKSRWLGAGRALGFAHGRAIRAVLAAGSCPGTQSRRAHDRLARLAEEFSWVDSTSTTFVRDGSGGARWWTFAGLRANVALAEALRAHGGHVDGPDNLSIPLGQGIDGDALAAWCRSADIHDIDTWTPVPPDAIDGLKFSTCLPRPLAERALRRRLSDVAAVRSVLNEPVRSVTVGVRT